MLGEDKEKRSANKVLGKEKRTANKVLGEDKEKGSAI